MRPIEEIWRDLQMNAEAVAKATAKREQLQTEYAAALNNLPKEI